LPASAGIKTSSKVDAGDVPKEADGSASAIKDSKTYGFINPPGTTVRSGREPNKYEKPRDEKASPKKPGFVMLLFGRLSCLKHDYLTAMGQAVTIKVLLAVAVGTAFLFLVIGFLGNLVNMKMDSQELSEEYRGRADEMSDNMDYLKSAEYYAVSIHIDPTNYKSLNNKASMYLQIHRYEDAIDLLNEAIEIIDTDDVAVSYANRGLAHLGLKEYDRALEDLNTAIAIVPDLSYAYTARGFCYLAVNDRERALAEFQTACDLGDNNGCLLYNEHRADDDA
jgi:tetratricopeptide (TPR) repeat protein